MTTPPVRLLKLREVQTLTALSRATIYRYISSGHFPKAVQLGLRSVAWIEGEVQGWINQRILRRDVVSR